MGPNFVLADGYRQKRRQKSDHKFKSIRFGTLKSPRSLTCKPKFRNTYYKVFIFLKRKSLFGAILTTNCLKVCQSSIFESINLQIRPEWKIRKTRTSGTETPLHAYRWSIRISKKSTSKLNHFFTSTLKYRRISEPNRRPFSKRQTAKIAHGEWQPNQTEKSPFVH